MPLESSIEKDYQPLSRAAGRPPGDQPSLAPGSNHSKTDTSESKASNSLKYTVTDAEVRDQATARRSQANSEANAPVTEETNARASEISPRAARKIKQQEKDLELLGNEHWFARNGHTLTYFGLYLFSIMVLFRPYEIVPGLGFLSGTAVFFAAAAIGLYLPSQIATEGNLTMFPTEVKAILAMTIFALFSIPIAKDPTLAWDAFNDSYIKAVIIFIVLINV
ncbi:MAG: hypothetical protein AB7J13_16200, partial [Pyrinomonadaceae bacterium]